MIDILLKISGVLTGLLAAALISYFSNKNKKQNNLIPNPSTPLQKKISKILVYTYLIYSCLIIIAHAYIEYIYTNGNIDFEILWNYPITFLLSGSIILWVQFASIHEKANQVKHTKQLNQIKTFLLVITIINFLFIIGFTLYKIIISLNDLNIL